MRERMAKSIIAAKKKQAFHKVFHKEISRLCAVLLGRLPAFKMLFPTIDVLGIYPSCVANNYTLDLPFYDDVHCLVSADRPPRCVETEEAETGLDSTFYESVILLDEII